MGIWDYSNLKITESDAVAHSPNKTLQCGPCHKISHFSDTCSEKFGHPCYNSTTVVAFGWDCHKNKFSLDLVLGVSSSNTSSSTTSTASCCTNLNLK